MEARRHRQLRSTSAKKTDKQIHMSIYICMYGDIRMYVGTYIWT